MPWDTPLEVARWDAVRDEFIRNADDAELQSDIAFFFNNVRLNAKRIGHLFDFVFRPSATTEQAEEVRNAIHDQLLTSLPELEGEAVDLDQRLEVLETALRL